MGIHSRLLKSLLPYYCFFVLNDENFKIHVESLPNNAGEESSFYIHSDFTRRDTHAPIENASTRTNRGADADIVTVRCTTLSAQHEYIFVVPSAVGIRL